MASVRAELLLGNVGTTLETGDVILYDAGSYYAITRWNWAYGDASGANTSERRLTREAI